MNKLEKRTCTLLALLLPLALLLTACDRTPATPDPATPLAPLPPPAAIDNFTMQNLLTEFPPFIASTNYAARPQLILFFLPDDPACIATLPDWNALHTDYAPRGLALLGIVADLRPRAIVAPLTTALSPAPLFPVGQADSAILTAFGHPHSLRAIPTAFLLDAQSRIVRLYPGHILPRYIREDIEALLDSRPLPDRTPKTVLPEDNAA